MASNSARDNVFFASHDRPDSELRLVLNESIVIRLNKTLPATVATILLDGTTSDRILGRMLLVLDKECKRSR